MSKTVGIYVKMTKAWFKEASNILVVNVSDQFPYFAQALCVALPDSVTGWKY